MKNKMTFLIMIICSAIIFSGCAKGGPDKNSIFSRSQSGLYPAYVLDESGEKWGYINEQGDFVIQPKYENAADFQPSGLTQVSENGKWGLIDQKGKIIAETKYVTVFNFSDKASILTDEAGQSLLIDKQGRILFQTRGVISELQEGMAAFQTTGDDDQPLYGYINESGKVIIHPQYESAQTFKNNKALVKLRNGNFAVIDKKGKIHNEIENKVISDLSEDILVFSEPGDEYPKKYGYMTVDGKILLDAAYSEAQPFENGLAVVNTAEDYGNQYGVINQKGEFVIPDRYSQIASLKNGIFAVAKEQDYSFNSTFVKKALFEKTGRQLTGFRFYDLERLNKDLISATDEKNTFMIDNLGNKVKNFPAIAGIGTVKICGNLYQVEADGRLYYLTLKGKQVWASDDTIRFASGLQVKLKTFRPDRCMLIQYPEIDGLTNQKVEQKINSVLKNKFIGNHRASSKEGEVYTETVDIDFTAQLNKNLLTISQSGYFYPIGAAHGQPYREDYHIDISSGKFYILQDLFKKDSQYNRKLTELINQRIIKTNQELGEPYYTGEIDSLEADNRFAANKEGLMVYFQPYEIACYAAGFPEFYISWRELTDIINMEGDFWQSFDKNTTNTVRNPAAALSLEEKSKVEDTIDQYEKNIIEAVNRNDFKLVKPWLYPDSSLYLSQQKLVNDLNQKGIKERLDGYKIDSIEADNLGVTRAYVTEHIAIKFPGKEYESRQFKWVYCLKYDYDLKQYQLTYIEKWGN